MLSSTNILLRLSVSFKFDKRRKICKSAFRAAVILVLVLVWKDILERGSKWIGTQVESKWASPTVGAVASALLVTLIGVILIYFLSYE